MDNGKHVKSEDMLRKAIQCPHCDELTLSIVRGDAEEPELPDHSGTVTYLLQCERCGRPSNFQQSTYGGDTSDLEQVWPHAGRILPNVVPEELRREHHEAVICLRAKAY